MLPNLSPVVCFGLSKNMGPVVECGLFRSHAVDCVLSNLISVVGGLLLRLISVVGGLLLRLISVVGGLLLRLISVVGGLLRRLISGGWFATRLIYVVGGLLLRRRQQSPTP